MTGRGVDQILRHPCPPHLYEGYVNSAIEYVHLAEEANGPIPRLVTPAYVWGVALDELNRARSDLRIINLETSITRSEDYLPKGINYRMSPENAECLRAAGIDCCVLANNHVLDWGRAGLLDTLSTLEHLHIKSVGAGRDLVEASAPAIFEMKEKGRAIVFALACVSSGTPKRWAATHDAPGVNVFAELSGTAVAGIAEQAAKLRRPGDIVVVSVHWGSNWGYEIAKAQQEFAHALIDEAGVSIVHGHSSHHPKAIEVFKNRLVLYGCGDFLNDYEGIRGYEEFRDDLALMYLADINPANGDLIGLEMVPLQIRRFELVHASGGDVDWIRQTLDRECQGFGAHVELNSAGQLALSWPEQPGT